MKKLKQAIATFILQGKDFWSLLKPYHIDYIIYIVQEEYKDEFDLCSAKAKKDVKKWIDDGIYDKSEFERRVKEEKINFCYLKVQELIPCFFEE
jgi:hypothetical protein